MPSPDPLTRKLDELGGLAEASAWAEIEAVIRGLPEWLGALADAERAAALRTLEVYLLALKDRVSAEQAEVGSSLRSLRSGRKAVQCYQESERPGRF